MLGIGSNHGGYQLKQAIMKHLEKRGIASPGAAYS